jgi:hypothetical protein
MAIELESTWKEIAVAYSMYGLVILLALLKEPMKSFSLDSR